MIDISISRNHAKLRHFNSSFYLEDNCSKFGTIVLIQNDILFHYQRQVAILINSTYLVGNLVKSCCAKLRCYHNKLLESQDLNEYLKGICIVSKEIIHECCFVSIFINLINTNYFYY